MILKSQNFTGILLDAKKGVKITTIDGPTCKVNLFMFCIVIQNCPRIDKGDTIGCCINFFENKVR